MVVTVNTDASFSYEYKIGAYAYWLVYNGQRIKRAGLLKDCQSSHEAEIKAIANALFRITRLPWTGIFLIVINTDCIYAIDVITGKTKIKKISESSTAAISAIRNYTTEIRVRNKCNKSNTEYVDYRHVKAHTSAKDKRSYVNDWCDKQAKQLVRNQIQKLKSCQVKNSPDGG